MRAHAARHSPAHSGRIPEIETRLLPWLGDRKSDAVRLLFRVKVDWTGFDAEKFASGPLIIAANHRSLVDTVVVRLALPPAERRRTVTIGARDFFAPAETDRGLRWLVRAAVCQYIVRMYRVCLIGRGDDMGDGVPAITGAIARGWNVVLFPEGTRSRTKELGRFRMGVAHIARQTGARVLPVWISGTERVMPVGSRWLHSGAIRLFAGDPIQIGAGETNSEFLERMRGAIMGLASQGEP